MSRKFWRATAEAVVNSIDATFSSALPATPDMVAAFASLTEENARSALELASDMKLLNTTDDGFNIASPLCRALVSPSQQRKATALRIALEDYVPFIVFRDRLRVSGDAVVAARQVKSLLSINLHHEEIKETLLSLGQYCQVLNAAGGGIYTPLDDVGEDDLSTLAAGCSDDAKAEALIRSRIGASEFADLSRENVIKPLVAALQLARVGDGRGAVVRAGNAIESFLIDFSSHHSINLSSATGINAIASEISKAGQIFPSKVLNVSKFIGHIRNAADHGVDKATGAPWDIGNDTGLVYTFVCASFIRTVLNISKSNIYSL